MATIGTLATVGIQVQVQRNQLTAGLAAVHGQLLGFIPHAQMLGGRIGGALIGGIGHQMLANRAQAILAGPMQQVILQQRILAGLRAVQAPAQMIRNQVEALQNARIAARNAHEQLAGVAAQIGAVSLAAALGVGTIAALTSGLISAATAAEKLAETGAGLAAAEHNVELVFGRWSDAVAQGAERQARAFGQSKAEYLSYAAAIGRELTKLGVGEDIAADQATRLLDAVQRLAQSRRIGFGEAFGIATARGALFTEDQVRAFAFQNKLISTRNAVLNEGALAALRNLYAIERINETTEAAAGAGANWNSQMIALQGNLANLAATVGRDLEPAFVRFFQIVNGMLEKATVAWAGFRALVLSTMTEEQRHRAMIDEAKAMGDKAIADARIAAAGDKAGERQAIGQALGGGGGGGGGFQGGLVEFARRVQSSAFSLRQIDLLKNQLAVLQNIERGIQAMGRPGGAAAGAGGGVAGLMAVPWQ